ncbi:MAG: winged helix-turn-helix domain-containing protein [Gammaproteobacteria bacterium]
MLTKQLHIGDWRVDVSGCRIECDDTSQSLEPKVMDLLMVLAGRKGEVVTREILLAELWPDVIVGEDTLARTVSKLRSVLNDSAKRPAYIETVPKRGYRLIADVKTMAAKSTEASKFRLKSIALTCVLVAVSAAILVNFGFQDRMQSESNLLLNRANDFYMRFNQTDNAAASSLYERVIAEQPNNAKAHAGLANTLVQRVIRYSNGAEGASSVSAALERGLNKTTRARELLARAQQLAERGVQLAPNNPRTRKALGLVLSSSGQLQLAREQYEEATALDKDAWESLINLGELAQIEGNDDAAIDYFSRGYEAMQRRYDSEPQRIGPWHAPTGVLIARLHTEQGDLQDAEVWYRRILRLSPYQPEATAGLAHILAASGDLRDALSLCRNLYAAGSAHKSCEELLAKSTASP